MALRISAIACCTSAALDKKLAVASQENSLSACWHHGNVPRTGLCRQRRIQDCWPVQSRYRGVRRYRTRVSRHSAIQRFSNYADALATVKPDAVSINTWPDTYGEYAKMALKAGCQVFIKKPLASTVQEAREIAGLAKEKNLKIVIGYILRVHP
jgi:hypothetical protein